MRCNPLISIVIPSYNRIHVLPRAIRSALRQTYKNFELIVIDDGSTDGTSEFVKANFPEVRLLRLHKNSGASKSRNVGIKAARGEIIAFLDSDDEWSEQYLEEQKNTLQRNNAVLAFCNFTKINTDGSREFVNTKPDNNYPDMITHILMENFIRTMSIVVAKKDALLRAGLFDTRLMITEDRDLYLRLLFEGNFAHTPINLVTRYITPDRLTKHYKMWGYHLMLTLDKFFKDGRSEPYAKLYDRVKGNAALQVARYARKQNDYIYATKMYLKFIYHLMREPRRINALMKGILIRVYQGLVPNKIRPYIKTLIYPIWIEKFKKNQTPSQIIFFITNMCNMRCKHCFYWKNLNTEEGEMSLEEIRKFALSLKNPMNISLTGGEPFLRKDLVEICKILANDGNVKYYNQHQWFPPKINL